MATEYSILRSKMLDLMFPLRDESQGRRLNPPGGEACVVFAAEGPGDVESDDPVGFRATFGRVKEIFILPAGLETAKPVTDSFIRL